MTFVTDPAYEADPKAPVAAADVDDADFVLVGHGHHDHATNAVGVAEASEAPVVAVPELAVTLEERGDIEIAMRNPSAPLDMGGSVAVGLMELDHSSSTGLMEGDVTYAGVNCGFIIEGEEQTLFFAGDTGICANLKIAGEVYDPDVALLPISGGPVMDAAEAGIATSWLDPAVAIPMHFDSLELLPDADPADFEAAVSEHSPATRTVVLDQGESITV
jgi:L-ascorbate metabolism protein UlaG (beta-lactamase superfamily)